MNHLNRLLSERPNRHAWLVAYALLAVGVSVLAAGLGIDGWWLPGMCLIAIRPTGRRCAMRRRNLPDVRRCDSGA